MRFIILTILTAICLTACGSWENLSNEEAYDRGYRIGSGIRALTE